MQEQLTPAFGDYELIDTGDFEKLERFGRYVTRRPEPQAIWRRTLSEEEWRRAADASFLRDTRSEERGEWRLGPEMPSRWTVDYVYKGMRLRMRLGLTSFKHVGIFPEQAANWNFIYDNCRALASGGAAAMGIAGGKAPDAMPATTAPAGAPATTASEGVLSGAAPKGRTAPRKPVTPRVLNLFAYTGGASLAARAAGAETTHVDSVKQVVTWSRENMELSGLDGIRWIVEDALKFVRREVRRGSRYNGIILDPPAFTKSRRTANNAEKGYKEINLRAMRLLPRGGYLATASCSHFMPAERFERMLRSAAADAGVELRQIEARTQASDHPILWNVPETDYLKFYLFQVV